MLKPDSSLKQIRLFLKEFIGSYYSNTETDSIIQIIFDHFELPYIESFNDPDIIGHPDIILQINEITIEITKKKPIQYILGYTFFHDLKIEVNENVLIPRPETEELVNMVISETERDRPVILDVGTGSGCIAIALKKSISGATLYAVDKYPEILSLSRANAEMNHTEISFLEVDFLDNPSEKIRQKFDIIVSNPPYVTPSEMRLMDDNVLEHEPHGALFVEEADPLQFFRAIAEFAVTALNSPGEIWVEINEKFGKEIQNLFIDSGFSDCRILKDIHGKERYIHVMGDG